jgi:hypothetical protein
MMRGICATLILTAAHMVLLPADAYAYCNTCNLHSKAASSESGRQDYTFYCIVDDGGEEVIKVTAGNDEEAQRLAVQKCG